MCRNIKAGLNKKQWTNLKNRQREIIFFDGFLNFATWAESTSMHKSAYWVWRCLWALSPGWGRLFFTAATRYVEYYALGIAGYNPQPRPAGEAILLPPLDQPFRPWLLLLIPTLGGLASGVLVYSLAPEAEGHGTDAVIVAYHSPQGQIRPRVPLVKIVTSALTIGTGGSGGREGPIAQIGAGFGSVLANLLHLRPANRRILMAAGMGAGIAAIFRHHWQGHCSPRRCFIARRSSSLKSLCPPP